MESELWQMRMMHTFCDKEVESLLKNLTKFLEKSKEIQDFVNAQVGKHAGDHKSDNLAAVLTFDHFMNQITSVINMTRKLNIHLHLNPLEKIASNATYKDTSIGKNIIIQASQKSIPLHKSQDGESALRTEHLIDTDERRSDDSDVVLTTLPKKDFTNFKEGFQFAASVTYVEDHKELVFYICEINDFQKLFELNDPLDMQPITLKAAKQMVFYVSHQKPHFEGRGLIWRGILLSGDNNMQMDDMILLIDFGERIPVNSYYKLYTLPKKYQNIPPLAIRCILEGCQTVDGMINRCPRYCASKLLANEFKIAQFRVVRCKCNMLYLILLENRNSNNQKSENKESQTIDDSLNPSHFAANDMESNPSESMSQQTTDDIIIITVTHVTSLVSFYAIIRDDKLPCNRSYPQSKLYWQDNEVSTKQKQQVAPVLNSMILIQNIKNCHWYRGRILEIQKQKQIFKVFYVDYGNTEFVPLSCLAECTELQLKHPERAMRFRLADLSELLNDVNNPQYPTFLQKLSDKILNQTWAVKVIERNPEEWKLYSIDEPWGDIRKLLLDLKAVSENPIDCQDCHNEKIYPY